MENPLIGVLAGAVIASIVPIFTLVTANKRWKSEKKIDFLKARYDRLEKMYTKCLDRFASGLENDNYEIELFSDVHIFGSKSVVESLDSFLLSTDPNKRSDFAYMDLSKAAKQHLKEIDDQIERLLN